MKEWHFFDKVYRVWVVVLVSEPEYFYEFMMEFGYKEIDKLRRDATAAYCISMNSNNNDIGNTCYILWFRKFKTACLVHELNHLVMSIFDDRGVPICLDNTETFSYYTEFWFNEIMRVKRRLPNGSSAKDAKK